MIKAVDPMNYTEWANLEQDLKIEALRRLKELVKKKGQAGAARDMGVTTPYVHDLMHGRRKPGDKVLRKLLG